jgi:hypothetical protein
MPGRPTNEIALKSEYVACGPIPVNAYAAEPITLRSAATMRIFLFKSFL